jgi:hypothetical protein
MRWTLWLWELGAVQLVVESDNRPFAEDRLVTLMTALKPGQSVRLYDGTVCKADIEVSHDGALRMKTGRQVKATTRKLRAVKDNDEPAYTM